MENVKDLLIFQNLIPGYYKILRLERGEFLKPYSITPSQYDVMAELEIKSQNLSSLAENIYLDNSTVVGIIDRLEKKNWVTKKVSPKDRRKNIISLTKEGRDKMQEIPEFISPSIKKLFKSISAKDRQNFTRILQNLASNSEKKTEEPELNKMGRSFNQVVVFQAARKSINNI